MIVLSFIYKKDCEIRIGVDISTSIYPTIGFSLNKTFYGNMHFGFDWEIARGASIYLGVYVAKYQGFNQPKGFQMGITLITQEDFNIRQYSTWEAGFGFGINVDIPVITGLYKVVSGSGKYFIIS